MTFDSAIPLRSGEAPAGDPFPVPILLPNSGVEVSEHGLVATTETPWLELILPMPIPAGRWVRLSYRASYLDHLVRPMIRFETAEASEFNLLRAPLFGRASWIGRVPDDTRRIFISPVNVAGPFAFEIEKITGVSRARLLRRALRKDQKTAAMALGARLINARQETRQALMFARGGVNLATYPRWRRGRLRPFEPDGIDVFRTSAEARPHIRFVLQHTNADPEKSALSASLQDSYSDNWSLCLPASCKGPSSAWASERIIYTDDPCAGLAQDDLVVAIPATARLAEYALPVVAESAARFPAAECLYGDEDERAPDGTPRHPRFKPDWSPQLEAEQPYLGQAVFWRVRTARRLASKHPFDSPAWRHQALTGLVPPSVRHIRRVLLSAPAARASVQVTARAPQKSRAPDAKVTLIVPTKNKLNLISACLRGLCFNTAYPISEILVADNGSDSETKAFYATLAGDRRVRVLSMPGPFNFSAMCNSAAAQACGEALVFLNNDVSVSHPDWLTQLVARAMRPDTGAVGAKLLFPSGAIQHAGMVVGMGGFADHVCHGAPASDAGYLSRLRTAHEVGAVTGACIAVEARKFHAVGGFNAIDYPVELSDVDLCLRLAARGWSTVLCPESVLVHHQSASRGFSFRPFERYARERQAFRAQWAEAIRDDPYFHPALSLFSPTPSLDG